MSPQVVFLDEPPYSNAANMGLSIGLHSTTRRCKDSRCYTNFFHVVLSDPDPDRNSQDSNSRFIEWVKLTAEGCGFVPHTAFSIDFLSRSNVMLS
ncbi:hypothetical protein V6N11_020465 [Hibiscus sabdariffa]|uniref:Uncharacterized protein n=1 Tax=Hibiscus sabdariffa TaxID=183260 RepID=A0ABR2Q8H2_9ROSI